MGLLVPDHDITINCDILGRERDKMRKSTGKASIHNRDAKMSFTAVFLKVPEGYVGFVEELPGANSQGKTLTEVRCRKLGLVFLRKPSRSSSSEFIF